MQREASAPERGVDPVVIGATGGSGTRVLARLLHDAGVFMGLARNEADDALPFVGFYDRWVNRYWLRDETPLTAAERSAMSADFAECLRLHRAPLRERSRRWGFKNPRSLFVVEFLDELFPQMRFIHVIRDGRDMAWSSNQNQLRLHGTAILTRGEQTLDEPNRSILLWARANARVADYAEDRMRERYLRIRFEDLCSAPEFVLNGVCCFLGLGPRAAATMIERVTAPSSLGRWQGRELRLEESHDAIVGKVLRRFGYRDPTEHAPLEKFR